MYSTSTRLAIAFSFVAILLACTATTTATAPTSMLVTLHCSLVSPALPLLAVTPTLRGGRTNDCTHCITPVGVFIHAKVITFRLIIFSIIRVCVFQRTRLKHKEGF